MNDCIRSELEALRVNRRLMMREEVEMEEENRMSERDRIQGGQAGLGRRAQLTAATMGTKSAAFPVLNLP